MASWESLAVSWAQRLGRVWVVVRKERKQIGKREQGDRPETDAMDLKGGKEGLLGHKIISLFTFKCLTFFPNKILMFVVKNPSIVKI